MSFAEVNKETLIDELQSVSYDYKATVIAAELLDNGLSYEDIYFKNISQFKRFVSKDVETITWHNSENGPNQLVFEMNREGLYDMLPEGLTHSNTHKTSEKEAIAEFNLHRTQERYAREFFSTFENEFMHRALQLEIIEREICNNKNNTKNREFFESIYGDSRFLTDVQVVTLMYILPLSSKIRGDIKLISETLSKILNYRITVKKRSGEIQISGAHIQGAYLNNSSLGIDFVISNSCNVYSCYYELSIYDIAQENYKDFIRNGRNSNVLDFILPYLFPVDAEIKISFLSLANDKYLKTSMSHSLCFLGFNSYI